MYYDLKKLALCYYYDGSGVENDTEFSKMIESSKTVLSRYMTIINHLESLPKTWDFILDTFKTKSLPLPLSNNEINFKDFRELDDNQCLYVYVIILLYFLMILILYRLQKRFTNKNPTKKGSKYMKQLVNILFRRDFCVNSKENVVIDLFQKFPELKDQVCLKINNNFIFH